MHKPAPPLKEMAFDFVNEIRRVMKEQNISSNITIRSVTINNNGSIVMESYLLETPASNAIPADCLVVENEAEYRERNR